MNQDKPDYKTRLFNEAWLRRLMDTSVPLHPIMIPPGTDGPVRWIQSKDYPGIFTSSRSISKPFSRAVDFRTVYLNYYQDSWEGTLCLEKDRVTAYSALTGTGHELLFDGREASNLTSLSGDMSWRGGIIDISLRMAVMLALSEIAVLKLYKETPDVSVLPANSEP